jgi:type 1 glutamine amidotransferase
MRRTVVALAALFATACDGTLPSPASPSPTPNQAPPAFSTLVFSKTAGFRHDSIPAAVAAVRQLGAQRGFIVTATEDATAFTDESLGGHKVVVFLLTTGDVLDAPQQSAFERFIRGGGGFVGVHSATDTEYDWPFYGEMIGAYFAGHPDIQNATVRVESPGHPSMSGVPATWMRRDEWYNFTANPRSVATILATLDERTYSGGSMGADHPIVWTRSYQGGRSWYTAGGHTTESYGEAPFLDHLARGILWAAGQ